MSNESTGPGTAAGAAVPALAGLRFKISEAAMIPVESGQAVARGWPASIGGKPLGVTWHWTVTRDLLVCTAASALAVAESPAAAVASRGELAPSPG